MTCNSWNSFGYKVNLKFIQDLYILYLLTIFKAGDLEFDQVEVFWSGFYVRYVVYVSDRHIGTIYGTPLGIAR